MPALRVSVPRFVAEVVAASLLLTCCVVVSIIGMAQYVLTFLEEAYPCGETYIANPPCRFAHPELLTRAHQLMIAVPAGCALAGLLLATATFALWRHAVTPALLALAISLLAFLTGQPMLDTALADKVPW